MGSLLDFQVSMLGRSNIGRIECRIEERLSVLCLKRQLFDDWHSLGISNLELVFIVQTFYSSFQLTHTFFHQFTSDVQLSANQQKIVKLPFKYRDSKVMNNNNNFCNFSLLLLLVLYILLSSAQQISQGCVYRLHLRIPSPRHCLIDYT